LTSSFECNKISWDCAKEEEFLAALSELAVYCKLNRQITGHCLTTSAQKTKTDDI